jgi:hypothetical protein
MKNLTAKKKLRRRRKSMRKKRRKSQRADQRAEVHHIIKNTRNIRSIKRRSTKKNLDQLRNPNLNQNILKNYSQLSEK